MAPKSSLADPVLRLANAAMPAPPSPRHSEPTGSTGQGSGPVVVDGLARRAWGWRPTPGPRADRVPVAPAPGCAPSRHRRARTGTGSARCHQDENAVAARYGRSRSIEVDPSRLAWVQG